MNDEQEHLDLKLRHAVSRLPRSILPERDLWTLISGEIAAKPEMSAERRTDRRSGAWGWALAASVAGICIGIALTLAVISQQHGANKALTASTANNAGANTGKSVGASAAAFNFVPASSDAARLKLRHDAYAQLARLAPTTRAQVEADLNTLNKALTDIQTALAQDPGNTLLQDLLVSTYQDELSTLANVQVLASAAHPEVSL